MVLTLPAAGPQTVEDHVEMSHRFLDHAQKELNDGRRLQASEKVWGAVSHSLSAIAKQRGWENQTNVDSRNISRQVAKEFGQSSQFGFWYGRALEQHHNFHQNELLGDEIQEDIHNTRDYIAALDVVRTSPAQPFAIASKNDQSRLGQILKVPEHLRDERLPIDETPDPHGFSRFDDAGNPRDPLDDPDLGDPEKRWPPKDAPSGGSAVVSSPARTLDDAVAEFNEEQAATRSRRSGRPKNLDYASRRTPQGKPRRRGRGGQDMRRF